MRHSFKKSLMFVLTILALTFSAVEATPAYAATLIVTKTADTNDGICNSDCSLREAIATAGVGDTITFASGLSAGTINLATTLTLSQNVTIDGSALASKITVSGDAGPIPDGIGDGRVFVVNSGVVATLRSLIITKGVIFGDDGGGIYNNGTLTVSNTTLSDNSADNGGGILNSGTLTVTNSTFSGNSATTNGGGIYNYNWFNTLTVTDSTLSGNSAEIGGGIYNSGTLTVTNSTLSDNPVIISGGGIYNSGMLTLTNSTLSGNSTSSFIGGGIYNSGVGTVTNSTLSGNSASSSYAGGIFNSGIAILTVTNSTLSGNSANFGGGINNDGTLTVKNSTFSGNSATFFGGGIYNSSGTSTITNSTLSGNSADTGGGIDNYGTLTIKNSTLSDNSASSSGGGIRNEVSGTLNYANTIIANSSAGVDCFNNGTIGTNTSNLVEDASCSASLSGDPNLGALADNGGPTQTFALLTGSSAIDAGDNAICAAAPVDNLDQRSKHRPIDGDFDMTAICDLGAYETGYVLFLPLILR